MATEESGDVAESRADRKEVADAIIELSEEASETRSELRKVEPDTVEEARLSARYSALTDALDKFDGVDDWDLPEWQIGIENDDGEWDWFYPRATHRSKAVDEALQDAREELGSEPLNVYEVGGPLAV